MQSFLPFSTQIVLEERHYQNQNQIHYPPPSAFTMNNKSNATETAANDGIDSDDLKKSLCPSFSSSSYTTTTTKLERERGDQQHGRGILISKVFAVGLLLFVAVAIATTTMRSYNKEENAATEDDSKSPLTLWISLDEIKDDYDFEIPSVHRLEEILNSVDGQDHPGTSELRWKNKPGTCPHCGQTDDDDDVSFSTSNSDSDSDSDSNSNSNSSAKWLVFELLQHSDEYVDATDTNTTTIGNKMLRGGGSGNFGSIGIGDARNRNRNRSKNKNKNNISDWKGWESFDIPLLDPANYVGEHEDSKSNKNNERDGQDDDLEYNNHLSTITTTSSLPWRQWVRQRLRAENENEDHGSRRRRRRTAATGAATDAATVNTAFHDSEDLLMSLLEDSICDKIEKAFPKAFSGVAKRRCRLEQEQQQQQQQQYSSSLDESIVVAAAAGGDVDEHGCIASAGYSWCESSTECLRTWEIPCSKDGDVDLEETDTTDDVDVDAVSDSDTAVAVKLLIGDHQDEHGCLLSAGYSWCESSHECHRPWEITCSGSDSSAFFEHLSSKQHVLGDNRDEHGCLLSAGYSWCKSSNECHRSWEMSCGNESSTSSEQLSEQHVLGDYRDEHGCLRSAGYSWCNASKSCHRAWETSCGGEDVVDVNVKVKIA